MKSNLFAKVLLPSDKFIQITKKLSELPPECLNDLATWFNSLKVEQRRLDPAPQYSLESVQELCKRLSLSPDDFREVVDHIVYLTRIVFRDQDDIHNILEDMTSQGFVSEANAGNLHKFFDQILEKGLEFARQRRRSAYERGELPALSDLGYDVDLRLIPDKAYNPENTKIEDYQPKGAELVPVAILRMNVDDGERKTNFSFQVNFSELEDIIVRLQACQKEMRLVEGLAPKLDS